MKKRNPHSPIVLEEVLESIRRMTPEEALASLFYRDPAIEETDMFGVLAEDPEKARKEALSPLAQAG